MIALQCFEDQFDLCFQLFTVCLYAVDDILRRFGGEFFICKLRLDGIELLLCVCKLLVETCGLRRLIDKIIPTEEPQEVQEP